MSYKMCEDCILISPMTNADSKSDGGIVVPGKVRDRPIIGTVLAVGPGMKLEDGTRFKETLKVGSIVVFPKKSGDSIYIDGQDFIVIPSRYILLILSEPDDEETDPDAGLYTFEDGEPVDLDIGSDSNTVESKDGIRNVRYEEPTDDPLV